MVLFTMSKRDERLAAEEEAASHEPYIDLIYMGLDGTRANVHVPWFATLGDVVQAEDLREHPERDYPAIGGWNCIVLQTKNSNRRSYFFASNTLPHYLVKIPLRDGDRILLMQAHFD